MSGEVPKKPVPKTPLDYGRWRSRVLQMGTGYLFSNLPPEAPEDYGRWRRDEIADIFVRLVREDPLGKNSFGDEVQGSYRAKKSAPGARLDKPSSDTLVKCDSCGTSLVAFKSEKHEKRCKGKANGQNVNNGGSPDGTPLSKERAVRTTQRDGARWGRSVHREVLNMLGYSAFGWADAPSHGTSTFLKYEAIEIVRRRF